MNRVFFYTLFSLLLILPLAATAQPLKVRGTVVAFNTYPLSNVEVKARKAKTAVRTDSAGYFELEVGKKDVILISESGFADYSRKLTDSDGSVRINLIILNTPGNPERVARAGYISRENMEFGFANLANENNIYSTFTDIYDAIRYAEPSANIIVENGVKGVMFRGNKTFQGSQMALVVVDGVIVDDISSIIPSQVMSIRKLSGPAASIYGARAGNGVIAIETR